MLLLLLQPAVPWLWPLRSLSILPPPPQLHRQCLVSLLLLAQRDRLHLCDVRLQLHRCTSLLHRCTLLLRSRAIMLHPPHLRLVERDLQQRTRPCRPEEFLPLPRIRARRMATRRRLSTLRRKEWLDPLLLLPRRPHHRQPPLPLWPPRPPLLLLPPPLPVRPCLPLSSPLPSRRNG